MTEANTAILLNLSLASQVIIDLKLQQQSRPINNTKLRKIIFLKYNFRDIQQILNLTERMAACVARVLHRLEHFSFILLQWAGLIAEMS